MHVSLDEAQEAVDKEKVDKDGSIIGFHVLTVSRLTRPLDVELAATDGAQ